MYSVFSQAKMRDSLEPGLSQNINNSGNFLHKSNKKVLFIINKTYYFMLNMMKSSKVCQFQRKNLMLLVLFVYIVILCWIFCGYYSKFRGRGTEANKLFCMSVFSINIFDFVFNEIHFIITFILVFAQEFGICVTLVQVPFLT